MPIRAHVHTQEKTGLAGAQKVPKMRNDAERCTGALGAHVWPESFVRVFHSSVAHGCCEALSVQYVARIGCGVISQPLIVTMIAFRLHIL